ncbi:MAG: 2-thiouracil desulfurase family protein [bacterium]|nr:2-thiouracil desulfurase family protein [bacterium]
MSEQSPLLVSACLAGVRCRWDGRCCSHPAVVALVEEGRAVPVCPEQLGGLPTPRRPARLTASGENVLDGSARVVDDQGVDVTASFLRGAGEVAALARLMSSAEAILKRGSPSCHPGEGAGVTAALLARRGLRLRDETGLTPAPAIVPASLGVKCWLAVEGRPAFGEGLGSLLEHIARHGSIVAAAAAMAMSYRQAWGRIRQAEERLGLKLVESRAGGRSRGGTALTSDGARLLESFRRLEAELGAAARDIFGRHFRGTGSPPD